MTGGGLFPLQLNKSIAFKIVLYSYNTATRYSLRLQFIPDAPVNHPVCFVGAFPHPRPPSSILLYFFHRTRCARSQNIFLLFCPFTFQPHWSRPPFGFPGILIPLRMRRHLGRSKTRTLSFPSRVQLMYSLNSRYSYLIYFMSACTVTVLENSPSRVFVTKR